MPPARRSQIEAHEINHGKGLDVRLSLAVPLSTIQDFSTVKNPKSLAWLLSAKLNSKDSFTSLAHVLRSGVETGRQNYVVAIDTYLYGATLKNDSSFRGM
ncbi:hypothetical protein TNCV_2041171 [Trichonephila clavipes]|nr:hypothetical protein TNCV_2041171 [Trichonephila clavipes]